MSIAIMWFRQDLRIADNPALFEACSRHQAIVPLYILDEKHHTLGSAQAWWLHHSLKSLDKSLQKRLGTPLTLKKGDSLSALLNLAKTQAIKAIYWNRCYEPLLIERDKTVKASLQELGIRVQTFNGSLLNEPWTIANQSGDYFKVFTAFWKTCRQRLFLPPIKEIGNIGTQGGFSNGPNPSDTLESLNLLPKIDWTAQFSKHWSPGEAGAQQKLKKFIVKGLHGYKQNRDFPSKDASSRLSPHLHFGEISPWALVRAVEWAASNPSLGLASAEHFLMELGWREFSYYLLYHVPTLPYQNYKKTFDAFPWQQDPSLLAAWQRGRTGFPLVDAGMRELWATGYMHNRVRMIVASFLTKDLFIDWRTGADWFLDTLLDADLANNSASWQWVAGSGADAAPYFRIFNPVLQSQKFDPLGDYIRRWIPELQFLNSKQIHAPWKADNAREIYAKTEYPKPIVDHDASRAMALSYYKKLKQ